MKKTTGIFKRQLSGCLFFYIVFIGAFAFSQPRNDFVKAIWVTRFNILSPSKIDSMVNFASKGNFTDILVQIRGRGDAFYDSRIVPVSDKLIEVNGNDFDPLKYVLEKAHSENIKVHAWLNTLYVWSKDELPRSRNHIIYRHPEWLTQNYEGNLSMGFLRSKNVDGIFLSPYFFEVKNYFQNILLEILKNYDIDGIHFDYIRYPSKEFGFEYELRSRFKLKTGTDPNELYSVNNSTYVNKEDLLHQWKKMRADALTDFLNFLVTKCRKAYPNIRYSCSVKPDLNIARDYYLQNWDEWLEKEIIDYAFIMNYTSSDRKFEHRINNILEKITGDKIIMGISTFNQTDVNFKNKLSVLEKYILKGFCVFSYDNIVNYDKQQYYLEHIFN